MKIAILYNDVTAETSQDELDVLVQVESVTKALTNMGHEAVPVPLSLNLRGAVEALTKVRPGLVFNLVESIESVGRFIYFAPALLDHLNLPYTGGSTHALYVTTDKLLTKERLNGSGVPTPPWISAREFEKNGVPFEPPYIVKPVCEDASVGLDERSLVPDKHELGSALRECRTCHGDCFAEAYVHGREFNLSLLAGENGPEVLPAAEILFVDYPDDKPRIVDYRAKWEVTSFEYQNTVRNFDFSPKDEALIGELSETALGCWRLFQLRGYARVDFRVDANMKIWVLEINANPCLSPDSGFVAAAERAGLSFEKIVERIIHDSITLDKSVYREE